MLVKVAARVLELHGDPKADPPKILGCPRMLDRCGMLPARSRERRDALPKLEFVLDPALLKAFSAADVEPGRNGLVEGVGLEVFDVV